MCEGESPKSDRVGFEVIQQHCSKAELPTILPLPWFCPCSGILHLVHLLSEEGDKEEAQPQAQ